MAYEWGQLFEANGRTAIVKCALTDNDARKMRRHLKVEESTLACFHLHLPTAPFPLLSILFLPVSIVKMAGKRNSAGARSHPLASPVWHRLIKSAAELCPTPSTAMTTMPTSCEHNPPAIKSPLREIPRDNTLSRAQTILVLKFRPKASFMMLDGS